MPSTEYECEMIRQCYEIAGEFSDDTSTNIGAIITQGGYIVSSGVNCFPSGIAVNDERLQRPLKYSFIEHAERNAIYAAARSGVCTKGATMYCNWFACADCARAIIQAGIERVVGHQQAYDKTSEHPSWAATVEFGMALLFEAGIQTDFVNCTFDDEISVLFNYQKWNP